MPTAALDNPLDLFAPAFAQRALIGVILIAIISAAVGWAVVLRDLPFFTHATGAGAYPLLLLGALVGVSSSLSALAGAIVFATAVGLLTGAGRNQSERIDGGRRDVVVGLTVVAMLASGAIIAALSTGSARFSASPEALLFGSLLAIDRTALMVIALVSVVLAAAALIFFDRWLASGFDHSLASRLRAARTDVALLGAVALATGAVLPMTGALLVGAMLILPAASIRILTDRVRQIPLWTLPLAAAEGALGLYASLAFDLPAGAAIALTAGLVFFACAAVQWLREGNSQKAALLVAALLLVGAMSGCSDQSPSGSNDREIEVVATTPPIADIVRNVGGDAVNVTTLLKPGENPHDFEPRPSSIAALDRADVIFRAGGDGDAWLDSAIKTGGGGKLAVDLSRAIVALPASGTTSVNSHWYLAPQNVARAAQRVRDELVKADPPARETFRASADQYLDDIEALDTRLTACSRRIAADERSIATDHDDFAYLAAAYGLRVVAQISPKGGLEPSPRQLQNAIDLARSGNARALVANLSGVSQLEKQVAAELGVPLLELPSDNLTRSGPASTLLGAIAFDFSQIASAVSGGDVRCARAP